jgi:hypothetical protein
VASVPVERHRQHRVRVAGQGLAERVGPVPVRQIPQDDRVLTIGGGQRAFIGEGYRVHRVGTAGQGLAERVGLIPVREIPEANGSVCVGGRQGAPIRGECRPPDPREGGR